MNLYKGELVQGNQLIVENELAIAVFDRFPVSPGHALVIPKRSVNSWWEISREEKLAILEILELLKLELDKKLKPDGYNIGFNSGMAAGQTIEQLHIHVIPRYSGDDDDPRGGIRKIFPEKSAYWNI